MYGCAVMIPSNLLMHLILNFLGGHYADRSENSSFIRLCFLQNNLNLVVDIGALAFGRIMIVINQQGKLINKVN